jgi:hypothetical protein
MTFHSLLLLLSFFFLLGLAWLWHLDWAHHDLPGNEDGTPHSPPSSQTTLPARLSSLSPLIPYLGSCRTIASACAPLARDQKPAGSPETGEHPGLRLS